MKENNAPLWLEWAKELQFIAQAGLTYSKDPFDLERFERIREISAEIMSHQSDLPGEKPVLQRNRLSDTQTGHAGSHLQR